MRIDNCEIKEVKTRPQNLKDGDSKVTTVAHVVGTLTRELAVILVGEHGAQALFSPRSWLKSGPVTREPEEGAVSVSFLGNARGDDVADPFLPSCGVNNFKVNGMTEKVSFDVSCERGGDMLYAKNISNPAWLGAVEIEPLQGALFPEDGDKTTVTLTDDEGETLFKGSAEDMHAAAEQYAETAPARRKR